MRHTRFFFTLAALCVFVGVTAGSALAEEAQKTAPPPEPPMNLKGVYGAFGTGAGLTDGGDDVNLAWRMMVWYRPFEYFAGEIGYANVDQDHGDFDGLHLAAVPTFPIRPINLDVFGKIGGFFNEDNHCALGLGAAYHLSKGFEGWGFRFDYDRLNVEGEGGKSFDILTLSLFYQLAKQGK